VRWGRAFHASYGLKLSDDGRTLLSLKAGPGVVQTGLGGSSDSALGLSVGLDVDHMITDQIMLRGSLRGGLTNQLCSQDMNARAGGAGVGLGFKF